MNKMRQYIPFTILLLLAIIPTACGENATPVPTIDPAIVMTQAFATVYAASTQTAIAMPTATSTPYPTLPPASLGLVIKDFTYCTNDNVPLKMDIYYPTVGNGPWPALLYIHGGTWMFGTKDKALGLEDIPDLRNAGYLIASVDYRQAPEYPFPAMVIDVKCAVRSLRAHAAELNIDPNHIGAWGSSSGGHVVALLGLADESSGWDSGEYLTESSRLQAVVDMFGPVDLANPNYSNRMLQVGYFLLFGQEPNPDLLRMASPVSLVTSDDPPFLVIQGDKDTVVDMRQSQDLYDLLQKAGVPSYFLLVKNSGHNFDPVKDGVMSPTREEVRQYMILFFNQFLKPGQ